MEQLYVFGTGNATVTRYYNTCFAIKNPENQYFMVDTGGGNGILRILEDMQVSIPTSITFLLPTNTPTIYWASSG